MVLITFFFVRMNNLLSIYLVSTGFLLNMQPNHNVSIMLSMLKLSQSGDFLIKTALIEYTKFCYFLTY